MKSAVKYFLKDRIIIYPKSTAKAGYWLADEPYTTLDIRASEDEIVESINKALSESKAGLANPTDWSEFDKKTLQGMGLKSWKVISDRSTKTCDIELENNSIRFIPNAHDLTTKAAGFYGKRTEAVSVADSASKKEIYDALRLALDRCE